MDNLIQQLKDNEKPFGLMSAEMQEKAKKMRSSEDLQVYTCNGRWEKHIKGYVLRENLAYRLRPDYEDEPEIEECEIKPRAGYLRFCYETAGKPYLNISIDLAVSIPDFIGFKFDDGIVMGTPVKYSVPGQTSRGYYATYGDIKSGQALEHHATHVLFRQKHRSRP